MGASFTKEQQEAIQSTGNVIVSAGAGSGKTTVLTERVRQNILGLTKNGKVSLDELLILTFTNDAATSMKNKIKDALRNDPTLSYLVPFVDSAHIETFDAYSQFIVKKYGYLIGLTKNINVLDDDILFVKVANTIDEYLNKQYLEKNGTFGGIIYKYCTKNDNKFLEFLLDIYNEILAKKDNPIEFLTNYKRDILNEKYFKDLVNQLETLLQKYISEIEELKSRLSVKEIVQYVTEKIQANISSIVSLEDLTKAHDALIDRSKINSDLNGLLKNIDSNVNLDLETEVVELIKSTYTKIYELSYFSLEDYEKYDIHGQINDLNFIIDNILIPSLKEVDKFKKETAYYTFNDIAKLAIKILSENDDVRNELKYKYKLIMIDETQDTSESQENFINLIANHNVFSVGDIKQSIYRFRNARPELFKAKYDKYSAHDDGIAINMNKNFRSRKEVLNTINDIFSVLMTDEFGGANYKKDHMIIPSNVNYDKEGKSDIYHGIFQIPYSSIYFDNDGNFISSKEGKIKGEAATICDNIKHRIENGYMVYDAKLNKLRPATYKDFTILTYKGTSFKYFEEVFKEKGIPLNAIYQDDLRQDTSIIVLINIFSLINLLSKSEEVNEQEIKHTFASLLRSFVFNYSDEELYKLFKDEWSGYKENEIFIKVLNLSKNYAKGPLKILFENVIKEFNYVKAFSRISDAINTLDKNNIFFNKTKTMDELGYTLDDFVLYLKSLDKFDIKMEQVIYNQADNAVTITTIHKSKGLEYPVVYLPNLFDFTAPSFKNNGDYYILNGYYFFLPFFSDPKKKANIVGKLLEDNKELLKADKEERLRLFYVALTRAKEDLIFIVRKDPVLNYEEDLAKYNEKVTRKYSSNKVEITNEDIDKFAKYELDKHVSENDGNTFEDFLFNAFISYEFDPYMDKRILDLDLYLSGSEIEDISLAKRKLEKAFFFNNHTFNGIDIFEILTSEDEVESETATKEEASKVVYEGAIKVFDEVLIKIIKTPLSGNECIANFIFYAYKTISKKTDEVTLNKIITELKKNKTETIGNLLIKNFDSDYSLKKDFEKIESGNKKEIEEIHIKKILKEKVNKASKDVDDEVDETTLDYGTHMHSLLESISFINPNYDFIKIERDKKIVKNVIELLNQFDLSKAKIFKEYQFVNEANNTRGIIDLLLVFEDKTLVIDYKLKNISDENYINQLSVYKEFVENAFLRSTSCYLLSILDKKLDKIL